MFLAVWTYNICKRYGGLQLISYVLYSLYKASKEVRQPSKLVVFMGLEILLDGMPSSHNF